jgi:hypothetical protein
MSGLYKPFVVHQRQMIAGALIVATYRLSNNLAAFAIVYGIFLSLGEVGPGNNLGLLASKTGPTAVRGQFYGLVAAMGKIGAFVGTWGNVALSYDATI